MSGQIIGGRYQILEQLGKGGFGVTFIAIDTRRPGNPQCVVKQFKPMSTNSYTLQIGRRLFDSEAQKLEKLGSHDQIPRLLAFFQENQEFYLVRTYALKPETLIPPSPRQSLHLGRPQDRAGSP